jgi:D-alanyl-lipoteichoic acid acyltransferase DltB (MBOAT superfamily)
VLFNSHPFIFLFLPLALAVFFLSARRGVVWAAAWLALASLFFYAVWNPKYVLLLLASIGFNFYAGIFLGRLEEGMRWRKPLFMAAIALNLGLLGYYKYAGFFTAVLAEWSGAAWRLEGIILPLGISFFTFTQIAFLVDVYQGKAKEYRFVHYLLFVTYFPHLIAGPILHHGEMMPQFADSRIYRFSHERLALGLSIFWFGLFKKTVLADGVAPYARVVFDALASGQAPGLMESWCGALAYALQLYFDFSGYSDMAIGLSCLFGIRLPLNFYSPYKAVNIIDFWRRWHISLSRFLRDYLYIPLGGNRHGAFRRYANLLLTMLLGGLWHGAGWTYIVWGGLHGLYLAINHAWRALRVRLGQDLSRSSRWGDWFSGGLTFLAVVVGWVFFRADSVQHAWVMVQGLCGLNGFTLPHKWLLKHKLGPLTDWLAQQGVRFVDTPLFKGTDELKWIALLLLFCWLAPNTQQCFAHFRPSLGWPGETQAVQQAFWRWRPSPAWALLAVLVGAFALLSLSELSEFIYFQF